MQRLQKIFCVTAVVCYLMLMCFHMYTNNFLHRMLMIEVGDHQEERPNVITTLYTYSGEYKSTNNSKNMTNEIKKALGTIQNELKNKEPVSYVTAEMNGRLGNHLFQYASLLGIAAMNNKTPFITHNPLLQNLLQLSKINKMDSEKWPNVTERGYASYDLRFEKLPAGNVTILSYLQSWKYFKNVEGILRKEFQFRKNILKEGYALYKHRTEAFGTDRPTVAVHVRRSDMLLKIQAARGYLVAPLSYLRKAFQHMETKFGNPVFLIGTDDPDWCANNLNHSDAVILGGESAYHDFVAMAQCDHMIMTVGSFGWWVAWFINGHTVYYKNYPRPSSELARGFEAKDYFMRHWVPIED